MHCNTLLQIGDRHLGNCLLRKSDCELIPIDFGHTFGSATFLLAVPELIPFRHSKQMIELMSPHPNRNAALEAYMLTIMKAMISEKSLLLSSMKAYLVDPILEWRQKSSNSLIQKFESLNRVDCESVVGISKGKEERKQTAAGQARNTRPPSWRESSLRGQWSQAGTGRRGTSSLTSGRARYTITGGKEAKKGEPLSSMRRALRGSPT